MSVRQTLRVFASVSVTLVVSAACGQPERAREEQFLAVGWVQAAGEVRIYSRKEDLGNLYDGSCISGVMVNGQTLPDRLQNRRVSVYGSFIEAEHIYAKALQGITAGVENYCGSSKIAIITRIEEVE
jgi:hypothetical protein